MKKQIFFLLGLLACANETNTNQVAKTNAPITLQSKPAPKQPTAQDFIRLGIRVARRNQDVPEDVLVQIALNMYIAEQQQQQVK